MDGSGSTSESGESGDTSDGESEEGKQAGKTILLIFKIFKIDTLAPSGINRHFAAKGYPTYPPLNLIPGTL